MMPLIQLGIDTNRKVEEILEEKVSNPYDEEDPEFKVKHLYRQCLDLKRINEDGIKMVIFHRCKWRGIKAVLVNHQQTEYISILNSKCQTKDSSFHIGMFHEKNLA